MGRQLWVAARAVVEVSVCLAAPTVTRGAMWGMTQGRHVSLGVACRRVTEMAVWNAWRAGFSSACRTRGVRMGSRRDARGLRGTRIGAGLKN
jgi:hypothetical protein